MLRITTVVKARCSSLHQGPTPTGETRKGPCPHPPTVCLVHPPSPLQAVLRTHFPGVALAPDIAALHSLPPETQLVAAGFPCIDVSRNGLRAGIAAKSASDGQKIHPGGGTGLFRHVLRLLRRSADDHRAVPWVLLENVPGLLDAPRSRALGAGEEGQDVDWIRPSGIQLVVSELEALGYGTWAHRLVATTSFGLPQRRRRLLVVASLHGDARDVLLSQGPRGCRGGCLAASPAHPDLWCYTCFQRAREEGRAAARALPLLGTSVAGGQKRPRSGAAGDEVGGGGAPTTAVPAVGPVTAQPEAAPGIGAWEETARAGLPPHSVAFDLGEARSPPAEDLAPTLTTSNRSIVVALGPNPDAAGADAGEAGEGRGDGAARRLGMLRVGDAERLQGLPDGWMRPALGTRRGLTDAENARGSQWRLIGNAVSVPVARWVGERLAQPGALKWPGPSAHCAPLHPTLRAAVTFSDADDDAARAIAPGSVATDRCQPSPLRGAPRVLGWPAEGPRGDARKLTARDGLVRVWPAAAWWERGIGRHATTCGSAPVARPFVALSTFLLASRGAIDAVDVAAKRGLGLAPDRQRLTLYLNRLAAAAAATRGEGGWGQNKGGSPTALDRPTGARDRVAASIDLIAEAAAADGNPLPAALVRQAGGTARVGGTPVPPRRAGPSHDDGRAGVPPGLSGRGSDPQGVLLPRGGRAAKEIWVDPPSGGCRTCEACLGGPTSRGRCLLLRSALAARAGHEGARLARLGSALIGARVSVYWPLDERSYEGHVLRWCAHRHQHLIIYEDGDVEDVKLWASGQQVTLRTPPAAWRPTLELLHRDPRVRRVLGLAPLAPGESAAEAVAALSPSGMPMPPGGAAEAASPPPTTRTRSTPGSSSAGVGVTPPAAPQRIKIRVRSRGGDEDDGNYTRSLLRTSAASANGNEAVHANGSGNCHASPLSNGDTAAARRSSRTTAFGDAGLAMDNRESEE